MGKKAWTFKAPGKNEIARPPNSDKVFYFQNHLITVHDEDDARILREMGYEEIAPEKEAGDYIEKEIPKQLKAKIGPAVLEGLKKLPLAVAKEIIKQMTLPYQKEIETAIEAAEEIAESGKGYICPICGKKFETQNALNSHMKVHK